MMRYIDDYSISAHLYRFVSVVLLSSIFLLKSLFADTQFELKGGTISGEEISASGNYNKSVANVTGIFSGSYKLFSSAELLIQENYDGVYPSGGAPDVWGKPPISEKLVNSSNWSGLGLRYTGLGDAQLIVRNLIYFNPSLIAPDYLDFTNPDKYDTPPSAQYQFSGTDMQRQARTDVNIFWNLPMGRFNVEADVTYSLLNYIEKTVYTDLQFVPMTVNSHNESNKDIWSRFMLSYQLPLGMSIQAQTRLKQNFSGAAFLNFYNYKIALVGSNEIFPGNKFTWSAETETYQRPDKDIMPDGYLENHEFSTDPIVNLYLRDVYTLSWGLFLKGTAILNMGIELFKERYELSIRKAWENESNVECGYFTSLGGLFPTQGIYLRGMIHPYDKFGVSPSCKALWEGPDEFTSNISFTRLSASLELSYCLKKRFDFLLGSDYNYYNSDVALDFPSRISFYTGIRSWIR